LARLRPPVFSYKRRILTEHGGTPDVDPSGLTRRLILSFGNAAKAFDRMNKKDGSAGDDRLARLKRIETVPAFRFPLCLALPAIASVCSLMTGGGAQAQGKLEATYAASLAGIQVGKGRWTIDITEDKFSAVGHGATAGLLRVFASGEGNSSAQGAIINGAPASKSFAATVTFDKKTEDFRMTLESGVVKEATITPPPEHNPERLPLTDAHRQGVSDPVTATLIRVPGNVSTTGPEVCQRTLTVFDGRMRYDLQLAYKRTDQVSTQKGYTGSAVVCAVTFVPIAGYNPNRAGIKYLMGSRDMELTLVPIAGTRVVVPYRVMVPTPIGPGILHAIEFVSVAQPRATAASSKSSQ
jgi:Protein of unknown function (DUF3108)